jgi:hypothetical protein
MPFLKTTSSQSLNLEVPAFHSNDFLVDSFFQRFDRFVHADMSTPRVHRKTEDRQSTQGTPAEIETLASLRETPDALARACGVLMLGHEGGW